MPLKITGVTVSVQQDNLMPVRKYVEGDKAVANGYLDSMIALAKWLGYELISSEPGRFLLVRNGVYSHTVWLSWQYHN